MQSAPWTQIGTLQGDVRQLQNELRSKADNHEIHSINRRLDSLEHTCGQLRTDIDGYLYRLQELEARIQQEADEFLDDFYEKTDSKTVRMMYRDLCLKIGYKKNKLT